jgi:2-dehydro-3-deoxyphosphogluconate aldolase/(4S)-4-hydroxy-2-oxoglutarate aldolase
MDKTIGALGRIGLIPVVKIDQAEWALPMVEALVEGGLPCAEITFRTSAAEESIRRIAHAHSEVLVGAGTVLTEDQAIAAVAAGAKFIVSPGFGPRVVDWCQSHGIPVMPGVATATEILMALERGVEVLKFFPAEPLGGSNMLKAIAAAFGGVRFVPTGGIRPTNLASYVRLPMVHACGGSWLVTPALLRDGAYYEITRLAREASEIVALERGLGERQ